MKKTGLINSLFIDLDTELAELHATRAAGDKSTDNGHLAPACLLPPRGAVCLVPVPFTDGSGVRIRPALVLAHQGPDLVVAPLTTHIPRDEFDVELPPCRRAGLRRPGSVRCSRLGSVSRTLVIRVLGHVRPNDFRRVVQGVTLWFQKKLLAA